MSISSLSKPAAVLAGEKWTTPAPVILSMTVIDTPDAAAPMTVSAPALSSLSTSAPAMSGVPSPESALTPTTSLPSTPPAALMSSIARSTPANSGGPRNARSPVCGSSMPTVSVPSPFAAGAELSLLSPDALLSSSPPSSPHAVRTSAVAAKATARRRTGFGGSWGLRLTRQSGHGIRNWICRVQGNARRRVRNRCSGQPLLSLPIRDLRRPAAGLVRQTRPVVDDALGDLAHRQPQVHRGLLDPAERVGLAEPQLLLQDALGPVDRLAGLQPLGEVGDLGLERCSARRTG